jgi:hypothetical protein
MTGTQPIDDTLKGIFALLMASAQHTHENLLRLGAVIGPVAAPGLAGDDRRTHGPLGLIVRSVDAGAVEKRKQPWLFMPEMFGQSPIRLRSIRFPKQHIHGGFDAPATANPCSEISWP